MALTQIVDSDQRNEFELRVQMVSCQLAMSTHGYASPVVETAFTRALELCRSLGHAPSAGTVTKLLASRVLCADDLVKERPGPGPLFWVLWGFGAFHQARAEHRRALQIGERLLEMAAGTPELLVEGHFGAGSSLYYLGEFQAAAEHLEKGWQAYNQAAPSSVSPTGRRAEFLCLGYLSLCLWHLGDVERAAAENARAFQLALAADQVYVAASGYAMRASLLALMQDAAGALEASAKALELADEYGFGFVAIWAKPIFGWALVQTTSEDTGLKMIEEVLTSYGPNTTRIFQTYLLGLAAECHVQFGALSQARACVDEALALAEQTGERFWEPELFRLRGLIELEIPDGSPTLAHRALRRALRQAREQRARSIERRVLQQLMQLAGEGKVEASTLDELAAIYGNTAAQLSHSSSMQ
jgi:tetratricopeptide (TPR) repeat protein